MCRAGLSALPERLVLILLFLCPKNSVKASVAAIYINGTCECKCKIKLTVTSVKLFSERKINRNSKLFNSNEMETEN